jgi:magnesium transporter
MEKGLQNNFIYFSQLVGLPVILNEKKIGHVDDAIAVLKEMYPKVNTLVMHRAMSDKKYSLPWSNVKKITEEKAVYIDSPPLEIPGNRIKLSENEMLLKETFWDNQIVDISGSKLVRVNDLHLLREDSNLWVVHIDIGFRGFLRRLGWFKFVDRIFKWFFSYEIKDRFISWKYVQPIGTDLPESLHLKVPYAKLAEMHPADIADILADLAPDERAAIFKSIDNITAAKSMQELPMKIRIQVAESINQEQLANILKEMPMDEVVDLVDKLPKKFTGSLFRILPQEKVSRIKDLLKHPAHTAGSLMTTEFLTTKAGIPANEILGKIRVKSKEVESIYYTYVVDDSESLIGYVSLRHLLLAAPNQLVSEIMRKKVIKTRVETDIRKVAKMFYKYNLSVIPVIDKQNKVQGIITIKDAINSVFPEIQEKIEDIR